MAQAESENISANVRWGIRQRMSTGTFAFRYNILGYRKGPLHQFESIFVYNCRMVICYKVLRHLSAILLDLFGYGVFGKSLL